MLFACLLDAARLDAARTGRLALLILALLMAMPTSGWAQKCLHPDFRVELIYEVPEIEHPSVVTCDDQGNLFVGEDPMDMRGPTTKEFDRILYLQFDAQGNVVRKTVFAENLSAVFGLVWHEGALYVMHAPHYTVLRDTDGDGVADMRQDLAEGFGPPAGVYGFNDHIVTGTRLGLDGRIYVSVGDKGIPEAVGQDGSKITLEGGGVVRMRPDGTELEIFSSGTRNHLDVAMDSFDNIFTYDNTDDGLGWWTRFTHHIPTGYYGYPYDYLPHPERHLPHISEHGGGSPVGAACYREAAWPAKYRNAAFHCEWGKRKVQVFYPKRKGATFEATMEDFLVAEDGSEFRPQDVCFSPDGRHMYVADWNFGGWTNPQRAGRLYRVTYVGGEVAPEGPRHTDQDSLEQQIESLGHEAHSERMRAQWRLARYGAEAIAPVEAVLLRPDSSQLAKVHAIWTLNALRDRVQDYSPLQSWTKALADSDPIVRAQAARALGLRRMSESLPELIRALSDPDAAVRMYAAVALGRIQDERAAKPLFAALSDPDVFARFAVWQALRSLGQWQPGLALVQGKEAAIAESAVLAATGVYNEQAVVLLAAAVERAEPRTAESDNERYSLQVNAVDALAEVHRKADPYTGGWWGTRPAAGKPARPRVHAWAGTETVLRTLREALAHGAAPVRIAAVRAQLDVRDPEALEQVRQLAAADPDSQVRRAVLDVLAVSKDTTALPLLTSMVDDGDLDIATRRAAVETLEQIGAAEAVEPLVRIAARPDTPAELLVAILRTLAAIGDPSHTASLESHLAHPEPQVRAQAIATLAALQKPPSAAAILSRLSDPAAEVRAAALRGLATIQATSAVPDMLPLVQDEQVRAEALRALATLQDRRALGAYLEGLVDRNPDVRTACGTALLALRSEITDDLVQLHQRNELAAEVRRELGILFATPTPVRKWQMLGAWSKHQEDPAIDFAAAPDLEAEVPVGDRQLGWQSVETSHPDGMFEPGQHFRPTDNTWALAYAAIEATAAGPATWRLGSDDQARLWINGEMVYEYLSDRAWAADQAKGTVQLQSGVNHIYFQTGNSGGGWQFSLAIGGPDPRFAFLYEDVPPQLDLTAFRDHALAHTGDAVRGERLFFDLQGVGCVKCHRVGTRGTSQVGPNLLGVGTRYPRHELIRSVLEPSNRIASGYELTNVITADGQVLSGIVRSETAEQIELVDLEGKLLRLAADDIEQLVRSTLSAMPNGLEKGLSLQDFTDIIAYLESLREEQASGE